jgi:hypothetical protein
MGAFETLAYFATAVNYWCKMVMKCVPDEPEPGVLNDCPLSIGKEGVVGLKDMITVTKESFLKGKDQYG